MQIMVDKLQQSSTLDKIIRTVTSHKSLLISGIIYKLVLEIVYIFLISPNYDNAGMVFTPDFFKLLLSYIAYFILICLFPLFDSVSTRITKLMVATTVVPIFSFFWLSDKQFAYFLYVAICSFILVSLTATQRIKYNEKLKQTNQMKIQAKSFVTIIFFISILLTLLLLIVSGGIDLRAFDFNNTYIIRSEKKFDGIYIYLFHWLTKVILPFLMVDFWIHKNKIKLAIVIIMQIITFLFSSHKAVLLVIAFYLIFLIFLNEKKWWEKLCAIFSLLTIGSSILYLVTGKLMIIAIFPMRFLFMPAQISNMYYDFFSINEKLLFRESLIGRILGMDSPYPMSAAKLLSPNQELNYNTGVFGDAYANGGFLAMLAFILLIFLILMLIESFKKNTKYPMIFTYFFCYYAIVWNDLPLLTSLLTGGCMLMLALMYVYSISSNRDDLDLKS